MSDQPKPPDFSSLTENLSQQQAKISALKELVRQSESQAGKNTASAQEKVKNIAQRLSNLKSKASKSKLHRASSEVSEDYNITHYEEDEHDASPSDPSTSAAHAKKQLRARSETPGSEKITLLRQQMEVNRMKMAEREHKSKEIEQMVTQLKSKFETSQMSLEKSVELGRSMGDLTTIPSMLVATQHRSVSDVSRVSQPINLENERIKFLEKRILDLEESLKAKENAEDKETRQNLERKILDLEENLREKQSIIEARTKAVSLLSENLTKKKKDVVDSLEETKIEMFKMQETFLEAEMTYKNEVHKLNNVIMEKSDEITNLYEKCEILEKSRYDLTIENSELKTKLEDVQDYSTKISELNKLNETLQKRISTLESQRYEFITEDEVGEAKFAEEHKESRDELLNKIKLLEGEIEKLQENLQEKTIEANVVNANMAVLQEKYNALNSKPMFSSDTAVDEASQEEITKLKQQLDDSNKSMIKTKLKMKQMQKQIDSLQKSSDGSKEIARLSEEVQTLTQRIAELEEEKGSYQLQLVGKDTESDLERKMKVLETTCQNQNAAIQLLEEQKADISEDLSHAKQELETVNNTSELKQRIEKLEALNESLEKKLQEAIASKDEVTLKMNQYLNENMELLDKLEKISKGSSAESIEMVAQLTAQEKYEIEQYQKGIEHKDDESPEISQELNESLRSLRLESSELMEKIDLFTTERREVLEKLDALSLENQVLSGNLEHVKEEKLSLEKEIEIIKESKRETEELLGQIKSEKEDMAKLISELTEQRGVLQDEINKLVKEQITASPDTPTKSAVTDSDESSPSKEETSSIDKESCEKLLQQLDNEIQNLHKNKDKNQKLKISKKLSDNAKNVHAMMKNLLVEYYKNLDDCKQLRDDLERSKILLNNVSGDKTNAEIQKLENELRENVQRLQNKNEEFIALQQKLNDVQKSNEESYSSEISKLKSELNALEGESSEKDSLIEKLQESIEVLTNERNHSESEVQKQMSLASDLRKELDQLYADAQLKNQRLNEKSSELDQLQHEFDMRLKSSTNEVDILKTLVAEQKQLLIDAYQEHELDINQKIKEIEDYQNQVKQMTDELSSLRTQNAANQDSYINDLKTETDKLKQLLEENNREIENQRDELLHKQETIDTLNTQIIDLYKAMEENSNKLIEKEDELQYLQEIADSNREEIRKSYEKAASAEKAITELREQLKNKSFEIEMLQQKGQGADAGQKVAQLESELKALEAKHKEQHEKLKKFAANLKKKQMQCSELEEKLAASSKHDTVDSSVVNELQAKVIQYEEQLSNIKIENSKLSESLQKSSAEDELDDLRWKLDEYETMVNNKAREIESLQNQNQVLSEKCDQLEESTYELQVEVQKLKENKQHQAEESKNIAELSQELNSIKLERDELLAKLNDPTEKNEEKKKLEKFKSAAVQLKHKLAEKKKEVEELTTQLTALKAASSVPSSDETSSLKEQLRDLEASNRLLMEDKHRKVSLEGQLETFELTNIDLRQKIARLEESVAVLDNENQLMKREKLLLDKELDEKDELIVKKLRETEADNSQLAETIKELNVERNSLLQKLSSFEMQLSSNSEKNNQFVSGLQNEISQLQQQIQSLQAELKKQHSLHEQAMKAKHSEIDEMETELSNQLQKIEAEKKAIQESLEKANDQIVDFQDEVVRLKDNAHSLEQARADLEREMSWLKLQNDNYTQDQLENEQLRMQLMQSETELENLRSQNETMIQNQDAEVIILRQQISDLEAMRSQVSQNQTDDQVMLQNENVKLKELLVEKENELQQKAIQLQMAAVFEAPIQAANDPFANLSAAPSTTSSNDVKNLEEKLKQANEEMNRIREAHMMANMELDMQSGRIQELVNENNILKDKTHEMQSMMDNLIRTNCELEAVNERQKSDIERKDKEISEIKFEMDTLRTQSAQSTDDDKLNPLQSELIEKNRAIENLQNILKKYEPQQEQHHQPTPQAFSTSIFFNDPQPSTSALFDDPFSGVDIHIPPQPVVEEEIKPKKAYLCYDSLLSVETQTDEHWLVEFQKNIERIAYLERQLEIMDQRIAEQYMDLEKQRQRICELEALQKPEQAKLPTEEPVCVDKKIYLCYETQTDNEWMQEYVQNIEELQSRVRNLTLQNTEQADEIEHQRRKIRDLEANQRKDPPKLSLYFDSPPQSMVDPMAALEIEDGWAWGADNSGAASELVLQQQQQPPSLLSPRTDLEVRLQEQKDIVERLESENNSITEELHSMRENSKKMMKKLKEYQQKIKDMESNAARRSSSFESNDMDLVIQEELSSQVRQLEAKIKEINEERAKEQHEKESLAKRVDVLTQANERMTEMKERQDNQMEMYHLKIKDLTQKLQNLEDWEGGDKVVQQMSPAKESQSELSNKIKALNDQIRDMQVDYDELQAMLEEEKNNNRILEEKIAKKQQNDLNGEEKVLQMSEQLKGKSDQCEVLSQQVAIKNQEIQELISRIDQLSNESVNIKFILEDLSSQVQQKTNENQQLNERLQKLEVNNDELSHERERLNQSVEQNYQQSLNDYEQKISNLQSEVQYKTTQLQLSAEKNEELLREISKISTTIVSKEKDVEQLKLKISELENSQSKPVENLNEHYQQLEKENAVLKQEKAQMEHELQVLNDQVLASLEFEDRMKNSVLELDAKNIEIQMLKSTLDKFYSSSNGDEEIEKLRHEKTALEQSLKSSIDLLNAQWSQVVEQRGNEVANSWKQHLEMREAEFAETEAKLKEELEQVRSSGGPSETSNDTLLKMKSIMESQEVEIVSLKEQLAIRSAEFAALSAKVDPYHQMSTSMSVSPVPQDSDRVPRSELDLALYMLHQRDMRLEEMTMELVRLLEERDTLQLRLSNSIRQHEEIKKKFNIEPESSDQSTPEKLPPVPNVGDDQLKAKLSELNTVRHMKDKVFADDREKRFMEHMEMFQRDVANIPPEAAARIVSGSEQGGQSPSSVLMNWILGKKPESS